MDIDAIKRIPYSGSPEEKEFLDEIGYGEGGETKLGDLPSGDIELTTYQTEIDEAMSSLAEEFDATGDESMIRMQKLFEDYDRETQGYLQRIQNKEVSGETKVGELPAEPQPSDISTLFEEKILSKRTSFLSRQLKKFQDWRARNKSNPEIKDELDDFDFEFRRAENEISTFEDETDAAVNEMVGESKQIELTPRGDPNQVSPEEADLFDDLDIFGESKSAGNMQAFGDGKLPSELADTGFSPAELGVEMSGDDFIISEGGQVLDLTGVEGEEMLGRIASAVASNSEAAGAVSRGLSVAGDVLGAVGIAAAVGSTIYQIYDGISTENKYEEAGTTYVAMAGDITKINKAVRESYNSRAKQMNSYTQLYHKWVFQKGDPTQEDKGRQMPLFKYSSNFDSISEDQRMDKISTFMISSVIQKQQSDLSKLQPVMRIGLQTLYNQQNKRLKDNIIQGLDRVSQGKENTKWGWLEDMFGTDTDSAEYQMGVDVKAQVEGGIKLKAIYDAYREMDLRNKFMTKAYKLNIDSAEAKDERFQLNTIDHRMLSHFEDQTVQDPKYNEFLQARTDEINKNFRARVDLEYNNHQRDLNIKYKKQEDLFKNMPQLGAIMVKQLEEQRVKEWQNLQVRRRKAYGENITTTQVSQNNYPKKYQFMINLKKSQPYWIEYYKRNKQRFYQDDINEILANRKAWLQGSDERRLPVVPEDKIPKPYTGDDDSGDYDPFINPKKDIKRIPLQPPKPVEPVIPPKPDEPIKPKPPPLPPIPKKRPAGRRLLGEGAPWDFEPELDNEFDENIKFDINIAEHLLHLCEHTYKSFDDDYFPHSHTFEYDEASTFGSEAFGVSEQGRLYYSSRDNVITCVYRGTDFGRTFTRPDLFISDLINDIDLRKVDYESLSVHSGFLDFFLKTQAEVMNWINQHINKQTQIFTAGHSYGAIPSVLMGYVLNNQYGERRCVNYNFGSPRGMDKASAQIVNTVLTSFRIAENKDPITLLPPSKLDFYHVGRCIYLDAKFNMREIIDMDEADGLYNVEVSTLASGSFLTGVGYGILTLMESSLFGFGALGAVIAKGLNFVELNKHSLKQYEELLVHHKSDYEIKGLSARTPMDMLGGADAVKDDKGYFYSKTQDKFGDKAIFQQTDNAHLKFMPQYHADTGLQMLPIPHNLQASILGFVVLTEEQYANPNPVKGICIY